MNARLKKWQRKWILVAIRKLRKLEKKILGISKTDPNYSSLSPISNAADQEHYKSALDWALKHRSFKDIKNIALTGPYGSGKSTILKTYWNNYEGTDLKFLFISLATFKEEDLQKPINAAESNSPATGTNIRHQPPGTEASATALDKEKTETSEKNQLLRQIETSILQQIFYHENDNKIPDSRFKKIRSFGVWTLLGYSVVYSLFLISLYIYLKPAFLSGIFKDWNIDEVEIKWIHYSSIVIITLGLFGIIYSSIRVIRSVTLQKLNFQNAEIGIGVNQNKSILNHHIDEILYFFSVRPYNVVIIEDLDRFKQTEIFTKLREINLLLNNSNKTKRKDIVFIYAVRDEMFTDKERTKFFDFIIPVIPIINGSNSAKMLMAKRTEFKYVLSDEVIEDVSYYIDDMRLLHNICNEFYLYQKLLDTNLKPDKLFAIITYKNVQPQQFVLLSGNSGTVFDLIHKKHSEIHSRTTDLNNQITGIKKQIDRLDELFIHNLKDLRLLYLVRLIPKLKNFKDFKFENAVISLDQMTEYDNFVHLENDRLKFDCRLSLYVPDRLELKEVELRFVELEKLVDPNRTYQERVDEIESLKSDKKKILQSKIQELEKEKEQLRNLPVAEVMQKNPLQLEPGEEMKLEDILVRNGYIAEDYLDYISLFHEGDISRTDYQFLLKIKNGQAMEKDYKLQKIPRVISKISPLSFHTHLVLNFDILDYLLKCPEDHPDKLKRILEVLKDESDLSSGFIIAYLERTPHLRGFIRRLSKAWPNIWAFFEELLEEDKKNQLFTWLVTYLDNADILALSKHYDLTKKIATAPEFPAIITDQEKMRDLLKIMNIKFQVLDTSAIDAETLDYIYRFNHYELNPVMLEVMMRKFGKYDHHKFNNSNYSALRKSECQRLITYVENNLNSYVPSVYLRLEQNTRDDEATILMLLNDVDLKLEHKQKITARMDSKINNLSDMKQVEVIAELFIQHKVVPTWRNILTDFLNHENQISQEVINFLNSGENTNELTIVKLPSQGELKTEYGQLAPKLALVTSFHDEVFEKLAAANSFWFDDLDLSIHSPRQVEVLVINRVIRPTQKSFDYLKAEFSPLHIKLFELEQGEMMKILETLTVDTDDVEMLLKSDLISVTSKNKILEYVEEDVVMSNADNLKHLIRLLNAHPQFNVSQTLLDASLLSIASAGEERIKVLLDRKNVDRTFLDSFIGTLSGNYKKITDKSTRPTFAKTRTNERFLSLVRQFGLISSFPEHKGEYKVYRKTK